MWTETLVPVLLLCQGTATTLVFCSRILDPNELAVVKEMRRKPSHANQTRAAATAAAKPVDSMQQEYDVTGRLHNLGGHRHVVAFEVLHTLGSDHAAIVMKCCADDDIFSYLEWQPDRRLDEP